MKVQTTLQMSVFTREVPSRVLDTFVVSNVGDHHASHDKSGVGTETTHRADSQLAPVDPPPTYKVILLNDDFTPMEFVIEILQQYFHLNLNDSTRIMLQIHHEGRGVCGIYSKDVALSKVNQVCSASINAGHPLKCIMEAK
jgi:ATP-dependent Clp protease adaptor protein ClpS